MTVKEWLDSGREYEVGRQLYAALGDNERLKRLFAQGANHYNREALVWELTKLAKAGNCQLKAFVHETPERVHILETCTPGVQIVSEEEPSQNPEISPNATISLQKGPSSDEKGTKLLEELKAARRLLYDERDGVHAQLEPAEDEEERRLIAIRMMELCRQIDAHWNTVRYVEAHGHLPPPPAAAPGFDTLPPAELLKRRNNLRSLVSKLKKKPDRAADLAQAQTDLSAVEALLNNG